MRPEAFLVPKPLRRSEAKCLRKNKLAIYFCASTKGELMRARHIMDTHFHGLHPNNDIAGAIKKFKAASRKEGKKVF